MASPVFILALLLNFLPHISLSAPAPPDEPMDATVVCNSTLYPGYCTHLLRENRGKASVHEYGFFSLKRSITQANRFLKLVDKYLSRSDSRFTPAEIRALQDCRLLVELNLDYLSDSFRSLNVVTNKTLSVENGDGVQTLLSATLTNQQTCLESLKTAKGSGDWRQSELSTALSNDTKLFSVSLSLICKGWIREKKKKKDNGGSKGDSYKTELGHGSMSEMEADSRRKLLVEDQLAVNVSDIVTVNQEGTGNFTTIMEAVMAAPNNTNGTTGYFIIYVAAGVYEEYVSIDKPKKYILIIGDGINQTIITGNRSVIDGWTTFSCATFTVVGTGFVGVNMTIRNTAGAIKHQAVALRNSADLSTFYACSFEGYQDTLYVHSLRQFYRDCDIYGTVDFIFGNAASVFQNCNLIPRLPLPKQFNAITAQGRTDPNQNTGISILDCSVFPSDDLAASNGTTKTYLGRPWKQYSRTVFMLSYLDGFINVAGWREWNGSFALDTLSYGEFNNTGPGSDITNRVTWPGYHVMNETDAENFKVSSFVLGDYWLPQTGVPYYGGLYDI